VPIAAIGAFTAAGLAARAGCGCQEHTEHASGAGAAAALAVHRFLEGSAVVLAGPAVAVALAVHAFAEGLATGALLGAQPRRAARWLAAMSLSPLAGAAVTRAFAVPAAAEPVLLALAAGILAQAARISLRAAFHGLRTSPLPLTHTAAVTTTAAIITALAVNTAG
jgi:zinc transporter ZupT